MYIKSVKKVTILILVDGFLQSMLKYRKNLKYECHNPYFSRWFSAISVLADSDLLLVEVTILILVDGFLQ